MNIVETSKDLEYYTNLINKTVPGFEKLGSNFGKKLYYGSCW